MSGIIFRGLVCDGVGCNNAFGFGFEAGVDKTMETLRVDAREEGWGVTVDGLDLCPECAKILVRTEGLDE